MLAINHLPHFLQTEDWAKFWLEVNPPNHSFHWIYTEDNNFEIKSLVYEFPWQFGEKMWYVPKMGTIKHKNDYSNNPKNINCWDQIPVLELELLFIEHINKIQKEAKEKNIAFVKFDVNNNLTHRLGIINNQELLSFYQSKISNKCRISSKKIQYLDTFVLDLKTLPKQDYGKILNVQNADKIIETPINIFNSPFPSSNLKEFFEDSKDFWQTTNTNIRRYTKKVIDMDWIVSMDKSEENFEAFWQVYNATKDRQNFKIHDKNYVQTLYQKSNTHIIVLYDKDGEPQSSWLGYSWNNSLVYLYGGNKEYSFKNYGQYLMHLVAIYLTKCLDLDFYDLGGWEKDTGYGKFKEQYKAELRSFLGPIDLPIKPFKFKVINTMVHLAKKIKKR
jgi:hypothetical protein